jgi:hypothetical protein
MPLKEGAGKKAFNYNVSELMHSYKETGKIGDSRPKSKKSALDQALAIAYDKQKEAKNK